MGASGRQTLSAMPRHVGGEQHEQDTYGSVAGHLAKAAKALLRMAHAPGRGRPVATIVRARPKLKAPTIPPGGA